jgi:hypothetical protein
VKSRISLPQAACLVGGALIGVAFGDVAFPEIEAMFGEPIDDIFFGLLGALFAGVVYEIVATFLRSR